MNKHFLLILSFIAALAIVSCLPEDDLVYDSPAVVEFKNHTLGQYRDTLISKGISVVAGTQTDSTRSVLLNVRGTDTVYVQLVGPQRREDLQINFNVRASSTAVEGVHFNFRPAGARNVIIPANSSIGYILLDLIPNSLPTVGASVVTNIDLLGNEAIKPSPNYDVFKVTMVR
ncbi:DUF4843 domain-containing protein [Chryseosolibacter indicus]|uniref:DUF4843 domain-containing protein n=1 Tax=Chryseosolibacter indicus TaxID=2782351 RepID=A0ABS5VNW2_9BACT|nr:DUF4843 domain-containing protein [Chryseosolibacter indicus]MBT1703127.1 DUF4843 domain-containing protein [Chryseosolibacter indicus]